jgi:hypothetical protein
MFDVELVFSPQAIEVTDVNQDTVAIFCNGDVIGTKLAKRDRAVRFRNKLRDEEEIAEVGDVIVQLSKDLFKVFKKSEFESAFRIVEQ